jgi:anaerobic ribonucleoside-triphosphate reductase|uniref:Anaerobic ribonucleoside triphosphate reductase n=1 Tax=Podoviridae sp. ctz6O13 TaxID=2827757 RepID=A0A8S5TKP8_9CAUD|nr:MAG TPA: anaerobic ribonucleoside triphosphate reductase [Podoviridae sp. ctz6O13]
MNVIKRDGRNEELNPLKVKQALVLANKELNEPVDDATIDFIYDKIVHRLMSLTKETIEIEEIQDIVVSYLKKYCKRLYKHYSAYRQERAKIRDMKQNGDYYNTILELASGVPNDTSKENSNKDARQINVMRDLIAGETSKKIYRENIMSPKLRELHDKGVLHVHDCDYRIIKEQTNCELQNLKSILNDGTVMNGKLIEKPHSLQTSCTIASQVITAVSNCTYGGQTITMSHLAPFVRTSKEAIKKLLANCDVKDEKGKLLETMLRKEIKGGIQTLLYQLNTMSCTNGQSPFITLFLYLDEEPEYKEEIRMLCEEVLRQRIEGMKSPSGNIINPTFPKIVTCITETMLDKHHKDYEFAKLCAKCVAKRMVPDFLSEKKAKKYKEGCVIPPMGKCKCSSCKIQINS